MSARYSFGIVLNMLNRTVLKLEKVHDDTAIAFGSMSNRMVLKLKYEKDKISTFFGTISNRVVLK